MSTPTPTSPPLSSAQLDALAELGERRTAAAGDVLYQIGDRSYPFIAIIDGEVTIHDAAGNELMRHGPSSFLGEMNFLSGQTVFVTATAATRLRYLAVEREVLRPLLFEDGPLSDLLLSAFIARREALQQVQGIGIEIIGPHSSQATMRLVDFVRSSRFPYTWRDPAHDVDAAALIEGFEADEPAAGAAAGRRADEEPIGRPAVPRDRRRTRAGGTGGGRPAGGGRRAGRAGRGRVRRV